MGARQLEGIRVLDLSRVLAGPLTGQLLGDLGAEVIKVERPGSGDESREYGPPFLKCNNIDTDRSAFYVSANRNKKSITLDLASTRGQEIARGLADRADILIENFRVGVLAKYGLDYAALSTRNPNLIYCSITGYGQSGPYRNRPGYDSIFQAMSGLMDSIGYPDHEPRGGPMRTGPSITDVLTSLYADSAILAALYARDARGGGGEHIDMALLDSAIAATSHYASSYLVSRKVPQRRGNEGNGGVPSRVFRCADGSIILTVGNDAQFGRFCQAIQQPDLITDGRFASGPDRIVNRDALNAILEAIFETRSVGIWLDLLVGAEVPVGPIYSFAETFADRHVRERGIEVRANLGDGLDVPLIASPIRYRNRPIETYSAPPTLGEHTDSILRELLGFSDDSIEKLRRDQII